MGAVLLSVLGVMTVAYPTQRLLLRLAGQESDFKSLTWDFSVDGFRSERAYSGLRDQTHHLTWNHSEVPVRDHNIYGGPLVVNGRAFRHGVEVHAPSRIEFILDGRADRFSCRVGLDDSSGHGQCFGDYALLIADGKEIYRSPKIGFGMNPVTLDVPVTGVRRLVLGVDTTVLEDQGSNVDWVEMRFQGIKPLDRNQTGPHPSKQETREQGGTK